MQSVEKVFEKINKELLPNHKGEIVARDLDTGKYFLGHTELDAYKKAAKELPKKKFVFKRIGFDSTHFVGAL